MPTASSAPTAPLFCSKYIRAAVLRPGDAAWTEAETVLQPYTGLGYHCAATYHNGEILLVDLDQSTTVRLRVTGAGSNDGVVQELRTTREETTPDECDQQWPRRLCIYTFVPRGELPAVIVAQTTMVDNGSDSGDLDGALSVLVYAMEADEDSVRWVRRDGRSLRDRVLFLGCPTSFAVDAARFSNGAVSGGSAYFVLYSGKIMGWRNVPERSRVYRHSFGDGSTTVVEELPFDPGWKVDTRMMWFTPQPSGVAPAQEIRGRIQVPKEKQTSPCPLKIIRGSTPRFGPLFKMYVGNLPARIDNFWLRDFFTRYCVVMDVKVICDTRTGQSWRFGFITMEAFDEPDNAIATFNGENFFGHNLRVKSAEEERPQGPFVMLLRAPVKEASPDL